MLSLIPLSAGKEIIASEPLPMIKTLLSLKIDKNKGFGKMLKIIIKYQKGTF